MKTPPPRDRGGPRAITQRATSTGARRLLVLTVVAVVAHLVVALPASAATESAKSGNLVATFTYAGTFPRARHPYLTITRSGRVLYRHPVASAWCGTQCWPNLIGTERSAVHVVRLQPNGSPEVVLDLYSGGAHCCSIEQVYSSNSKAGPLHMSEHDFGDPEARLVPLGAKESFDFLSADDSFAYAFTDYAASGMPIEVLSFSHQKFHNVTRSFPRLISRDAAQWLRAFHDAAPRYDDTVGLVAAWAADEEMLGHTTLVHTFLDAQDTAGHLNSALSPIEPSGQRFVQELTKFLRRHGYSS